jgi:magnesium-transporting ATPase (P-type)
MKSSKKPDSANDIKDETEEQKQTIDLEADAKDLIYKGQSPDEEALVNVARLAGYILKENKPNGLVLDIQGEKTEFETLRVLEFSSERKRMSVVIKDPEGNLILYPLHLHNLIVLTYKDTAKVQILLYWKGYQTKEQITTFCWKRLRNTWNNFQQMA